MKTLYTLISLLTLTLLTSCHSITMPKGYYHKPSKVGIIVINDSISIVKSGSQGVLDMAISSGNKYKKPLQSVKLDLSSSDRITKEIIQRFEGMNKTITLIDSGLTSDQLREKYPPAKGTSGTGTKPTYPLDLRRIKSDYDLDEVIVIRNRHGLALSYYGMIEIDRDAFSEISISLVDINYNIILFREVSLNGKKLESDWNSPPFYKSFQTSIQTAIDENVKITLDKIDKKLEEAKK